MTERTEYGSGNLTTWGYVVEWRLKPEYAAVATVLRHDDVSEKWRRAPYRVDQLGQLGADAQNLIRPYIEKHDADRSRHRLVTEPVAEAIIACLKTMLDRRLLPQIEWRIVRVRLTERFEMVRDDDNREHERRSNELRHIITDAT